MKKDKLLNFYSKESDIEKTSNEKIKFEDKEVFKVIKENGRIRYLWHDTINTFDVVSNLNEKEILKFIENIKILKNF